MPDPTNLDICRGGVTIGERCIIGAGSVVTESLEGWCTASGNPARKHDKKKVGENFRMEDMKKTLEEALHHGRNYKDDEERRRITLTAQYFTELSE